jgi:uncharacterized protein YggE
MTYRALASMSALALLTAAAAPAQAQSGNEAVLHIEASAQVPPDNVVMPVQLIGRGKTEKAALADLLKKERELGEQLGEAGIGGDKVKTSPDSKYPIVAFDAPIEDAACVAAEAAAAAATPVPADKAIAEACPQKELEATARKTLLVNVGDPKKLELLNTLGIVGNDQGYGRTRPVYSQSDPLAARGKARDQAIATARAEADAYAASLGYRVVRIERVSNAKPALSLNEVIGFIATIEDRGSRMQPSWFAAVVTETVAIDFVIAPK